MYILQVKLHCKIKLDSMQFRLLKASLEKEVLQVTRVAGLVSIHFFFGL